MALRKQTLQTCYENMFLVQYICAQSMEEEDEAFEQYFEGIKYIYGRRYLMAREKIAKSTHFQTILSQYDDMRFARYARTTKVKFLEIYNLIKDNPVFYNLNGRPQIAIDVQLLVALFRLGHVGNAASILEVGSRFGLSDGGTVSNCTKRVIKAICDLSSRFIKWPSQEERKAIGQQTAKHGLPNCIGFIDGSHVRLAREPTGDSLSYFNRKQYYSLNMAVVCTSEHRIIAFQLGYPGKVHDACVYRSMGLYKEPHKFFSRNEYIVGDPAYPLGEYIITPFRPTQIRNPREQNFNNIICENRIAVEHTFGDLKIRFKSLDGLNVKIDRADVSTNKYAWEWVWACLVLHNILRGDNWHDMTEGVAVNERACLNEEAEMCSGVIDDRRNRTIGLKNRNDLINFVNDIY